MTEEISAVPVSRAYRVWDRSAQVGLVFFTLGGFLLTSLKFPEYGLILALISQVFWLYSSYLAWRSADQIGMFVNTVITSLIITYGVINYWFL